jgi:hypothetical protein
MTIAIGAKYPWGVLNNLPPRGFIVPEAIILASDSRFSKNTPNGYIVSSDFGAKIFQIGNDVAGVYAGACAPAEECFYEFSEALDYYERPDSNANTVLAQKIFYSVYKHYLAIHKLKPEDAPLYVLLGACNKNSHAELYSLRYDTNFVAEPITGIKALGWPISLRKFESSFNTGLTNNVDEHLSIRLYYPQIPIAQISPMPIPVEHIALLVGATLDSVINSNRDATIGGQIQCAIISSSGVSFPEISYIKELISEPDTFRITVA